MCIQVNLYKPSGKPNFMAALGAVANPSEEFIENIKRLEQESEQSQAKPAVDDDGDQVIGHA